MPNYDYPGRTFPTRAIGFGEGIGNAEIGQILTCVGIQCEHIFDGKCENPNSGRTGVSILGSSPVCPRVRKILENIDYSLLDTDDHPAI